MTVEELRTVAIVDARVAYAAFQRMPSDALLRLQIQHQVDQDHLTLPETIAFGGGRLALIAAVLKTREDR
jgi:hypothetical protein